MSNQVFHSNTDHKFEFANGAIGYGVGRMPWDVLGPYAKVVRCPIAGFNKRLTCYATGYADTFFSVPACTQYKGKYISGYFSISEGEKGREIFFRVKDHHRERMFH